MSQCLHREFERVAASQPESIALVFESERLSYGELNRRANRLAALLRARGVGRGELVALCLPRDPGQLIAILATLKTGAAYLPIDPANPKERVEYLLADARPRILVTDSAVLNALGLSWPEALRLDAERARLAEADGGDLAGSDDGDDLAYAIYTSGSTGRPKGVLVTHRNVRRLFSSSEAWFGFGPDDVWTQLHSYAFGYSVWEIWGALLHGGRLVVAPLEVAASPARLRALLAAEQVTVLCQTPSLFRQVSLGEGFDDAPLPPSLRLVALSGEAVAHADTARWIGRHGDQRPRLVSLYALTEAGGEVGYLPLTRARAESRASGVVGEVWPDMEVRLLDDAGVAVADGAPGELFVGGAGLARGYLNRPELTAEKFVTVDGARLYRTGDRARRTAAGELELLGRADDQVKVGGMRVELGEIEAVLREHPAVREAAVALRADQLLAFVVQSGELDAGALRAHAARRLPLTMVPPRFVFLERLPLNVSGKLDRAALLAMEERAARPASPEPRDPVERQLRRIFSELLGVEAGIHDDYFDLGGTSLLAVRLFARIRQELGADLPLATLLAAPTPALLARQIHQPRSGWSSLVALRAQGAAPPFFCVHGVRGNVLGLQALAAALPVGQPFFALQAVGLDGHRAPLSRVEDMAACYLEEIRRVQPRGPYLLGGLCLGSLVALEMAQRLRAGGEEVALLLVLDPRFQFGVASVSLELAARRQWRQLGRQLYFSAQNEARWLLDAARDPQLRYSNRVRKASLAAGRRYQPRPYEGRITMIRMGGGKHVPAHQRRWAELAAGGLEVHAVDAPHDELLGRAVPSVARIVEAAIDRAVAGRAPPLGAAVAPSRLTPIQPGGDRPPLFCVHGAGGYPFSFAGIARHLPAEQPLFGLRAVGVDEGETPLENLELIASRYLDEIRGRQPNGPYHLAGMCLGGVIALEMAQQLTARGEQVATLVLIDPVFRRVELRERLAGVAGLAQRAELRRAARLLLAPLRSELTWWRSARADDKVRRSNLVRLALLRAARQYQPRAYSGAITLIQTDAAELTPRFESYWRGLAGGGLAVVAISGEHRELSQQAAQLARAIEGALITS